MWAPFAFGDTNMIMAMCDPENKARSNPPSGRGVDGYGIEWEWVESAGGAMVRPGKPVIKDINHFEDYVTIPDPDTWDWQGYYEEVKDTLDPDMANFYASPGCLFERLIACMNFENAIVALIDEDQKEGVHRFFRTVTDVHKKTYTNAKKWFNIDIANFNDDWGSQRAQFFSTATAKEMLYPYVKELVDHVHSLGMYWDDHCCGFVEPLVEPMMIESGMDSWGGQPLNNKRKLKEQFGDRFIFTNGIYSLREDASEQEIDEAVKDFFENEGADNRILVEVMGGPPSLRAKLYEASRKNYDRLVKEGKAIL